MFKPAKVIFDEKSLEYPLGKRLYSYFNNEDTDVVVNKGGRFVGKKTETPIESFVSGKSSLVVGVRKITEFQSCKPSANYQLPLISGCSGMCEYCYLNTQLGKRPYTKIYVNVDEILEKALKYINERKPKTTIFEGAATSDPIPTEAYTGAMKTAIEFFGANEFSYFRFVTKFSDVDSLIGAKHNGRTTVRFSLNTDTIIKKFERATDRFEKRIEAAKKLYDDGYKIGFIIAPVFIYENWMEEYEDLIKRVGEEFKGLDRNIDIEIISHRYTERAKNQILSIYPDSELPMDKENRTLKYGQFGYTKYVYNKEELEKMKVFFKETVSKYIPKCTIKYII